MFNLRKQTIIATDLIQYNIIWKLDDDNSYNKSIG